MSPALNRLTAPAPSSNAMYRPPIKSSYRMTARVPSVMTTEGSAVKPTLTVLSRCDGSALTCPHLHTSDANELAVREARYVGERSRCTRSPGRIAICRTRRTSEAEERAHDDEDSEPPHAPPRLFSRSLSSRSLRPLVITGPVARGVWKWRHWSGLHLHGIRHDERFRARRRSRLARGTWRGRRWLVRIERGSVRSRTSAHRTAARRGQDRVPAPGHPGSGCWEARVPRA